MTTMIGVPDFYFCLGLAPDKEHYFCKPNANENISKHSNKFLRIENNYLTLGWVRRDNLLDNALPYTYVVVEAHTLFGLNIIYFSNSN